MFNEFRTYYNKCKNGENKIIKVNTVGIKIYKSNWIEEYYSISILKICGCGAALYQIIYMHIDLSGNLKIVDKIMKNINKFN